MSASAPAMLSLTLLGSFRLAAGPSGQEDVLLPVAVQRIVAWLALRGSSGRGRLAEELWPDRRGSQALGNLRTAVWRANRAVPGLVLSRPASLALSPDVQVDTTALTSLARSALVDDGPLPSPEALARSEAELLPDWDEDWLVIDRERLTQLRLHLLEKASQRLAAEGAFGLALDAALAALRSDQLRESAHRAVIRVHLAEGNLVLATRAFERCHAVLERELGMQPSPLTTGLFSPQPG